MIMLKIKGLSVFVEEKKTINNLSLVIGKGENHILIGPNASGKTTLAKSVMGFPGYNIVSGKIIFNNKDITELKTEEKAKLGITMFFQEPPSISGVSLEKMANVISGGNKWRERTSFVPENLLRRDTNVGFSGGEKKISELAQIIALKPKFVFFDEFDSGLDLEKTKKIVEILQDNFFADKNFASLVITHNEEIVKLIKPNFIHIMIEGKIICSSKDWKKVWQTVKKYGFKKCEGCKFSTNR